MTRTTRTAPKASPLYARIRNAPDLYRKLLVVPKGHALRDEFSEGRMAAGIMNRYSRIALSAEGRPIGYETRSQLKAPQTPREIFDALDQISDAPLRKSMPAAPGSVLLPIRHASRGKSWYSGYGLPGAMWERADYGR